MRRKNLSKILLVLALGISILIPGLALANTVSLPDNTLVQAYRWNLPSAYPGWVGWFNAIGTNPSDWDLKRVDVTWTGNTVKMEIYTNYPPGGRENFGVADIALDRDRNGVFETAIKMSGTDFGKIYAVSSWVNTHTNPPLPWNNGNWIYGGKYDQGDPKDPLVLASGAVVGSAAVGQVARGPGSDTYYLTTVEFPRVDSGGNWNNFDFTLGSGTCANDFQRDTAEFSYGYTPLPSTLLLLGGGLLALTLLGRRRGTYNRSRND